MEDMRSLAESTTVTNIRSNAEELAKKRGSTLASVIAEPGHDLNGGRPTAKGAWSRSRD